MKCAARRVAGENTEGPAVDQLALFEEKKKRGGKRRGAGRPPKGVRSAESHKTRPFHDAQCPVHVVLRVVKEVGSLRRRQTYQAIRQATRVVARRAGFRIVHLSIQRTHVHLLVEAKGKAALAVGMQSFQISAAKHLNAAISRGKPGPRRRGTVFPDRYHAVVIDSPRQARHALAYVVNNWRKHGEDRGEVTRRWDVDWYSSGEMFSGLEGARPERLRVRPSAGAAADDRGRAENMAIARGMATSRRDLVPRSAIRVEIGPSRRDSAIRVAKRHRIAKYHPRHDRPSRDRPIASHRPIASRRAIRGATGPSASR